MSNERLEEAISLYKSGDKIQAAKILSEIVRQEPDNSLAWYGLALCLDEISKKVYCLKKVLAIDPSNQKAHQLLAKLDGLETSSDDHQLTQNNKMPMGASLTEVKQSSKPGVYIIATLFLLLVIGILGVSAFLFFNFNPLEKFESPEKKYSREIEPVLTKLDEWFQGPIANWDKVMKSNAQGEDVSNSDLFALYVSLENYPNLTTEDNQEKWRAELINNLVPTAESIVSDGYDIQVSLGGVTPPDSIKIAHQQIYDCVKYEVDRSNAMIKYLTESNSVLAENLDQSSCTLMPNALETIRAFVQDNR